MSKITLQGVASAKINLGLQVRTRMSSGYHSLETLFIPLSLLADEFTIEINPTLPSGCELIYEEGEIDWPIADDLILSVYHLMRPYSPPHVKVRVRKYIPSAAGLGGGSSDATFFAQAIAPHCHKLPSLEELKHLLLQVGSDCPYFLYGKEALGYDRGERLEPYDSQLRGTFVLVVTPPIKVSTREAFGRIKPNDNRPQLKELLQLPHSQWQANVVNDFTIPIAKTHPQVAESIALLQELGAWYTSLSGSGPSVFGLFEAYPSGWRSLRRIGHLHLQQIGFPIREACLSGC